MSRDFFRVFARPKNVLFRVFARFFGLLLKIGTQTRNQHVISGLFILTIVGVLLFLFNAESDTTDILNEEHKTTTFTPFVKTANNSIVNRKQFELQKAIKVAKNEKDFALVRTSKDYNKDIPFTIDERAGIVYRKQYNLHI